MIFQDTKLIYRKNSDNGYNIRLHHFIKISKFSYAYFAEVIIENKINNTDSENNLNGTETSNATNAVDGEYMTRIRNNIANIMLENLNFW